MIVNDVSFWRLLHSHYVDAVHDQDPDAAIAMIELGGGLPFIAFINSLDTGFLRVRPTVEGDDVPCALIEVNADTGWWPVVAVPANGLGIDDDVIRAEWNETIDAGIDYMLEQP